MIRTTARLLFAFVLAFTVGVSVGVAGLGSHQPDLSQAVKAVTESDDNTDQPIVWPANVGSPEQVLYAQAQRMQDAIGKLPIC